MSAVLLVSPESQDCKGILASLSDSGYQVSLTSTVGDATLELRKPSYDVVVVCASTTQNAETVCRQLQSHLATRQIIVATREALPLESQPSSWFALVPIEGCTDALMGLIAKAIEHKKMVEELAELRQLTQSTYHFDQIITQSPTMLQTIDLARQIAAQDVNVIITGNPGTGKELLARTIHLSSPRQERKFVAVTCSGMPELLLESELFGHVRGAFASATANKRGLLEEADGGTVFLDNIANLSPALQAKLLRVVQEGEIRPVGASEIVRTNVRVISAGDRPLNDLVAQGKFREDLYYRLNVLTLTLPPLDARREDIIPLAQYFLQKYCQHFKKQPRRLTQAACQRLLDHDWPGNVRELENTIKRAIALSITEVIDAENLFLMKPPIAGEPTMTVRTTTRGTVPLEEIQRDHIVRSLRENNWNYSLTASKLGIGRTTLWRKVKKFNIAKEK